MELFSLDKTKCVKCQACVRDCAFKALRTGAESWPEMVYPERCMKCQHCFALCPKGAIKLDGKAPEDSAPVAGIELPGGAAVENWMRVRRSVRKFQDCDVDRAILDRILRTLSNSPTGCNARGLKFTCYPDRAAMAVFREGFLRTIECHREGTKLLPRWLALPAIRLRNGTEDMFFRGAGGMLIVSCDETAPGVATPFEDVIAACTYFELLAQCNGIATCWCGFMKMVQSEIPELLEETTGLRRTTPFYAMLFGKSAIRYARTVQRDSYATIEYKG